MKVRQDDLIVGIDVGSSKIVVAIAEYDQTSFINVLGIGEASNSGGIRNGVIINIDSVSAAIIEATEKAEMQAGREVKGAFIGISGLSIKSINSEGIVAISGPNKEIHEEDINRVIEAAKAVAIPMDREILHIIPQSFTIDGQIGINNPMGMIGTRLECKVHILTTAISLLQNYVKSVERAGIQIYDIVLQNLSTAKVILTEEEKELGVLLLDIGAETVNASIYFHKAPYFNKIYQIGGYLITSDLAKGLKVSIKTAEKVKLAFGVAHFDLVDSDEKIPIPSVGGREPRLIPREHLAHIIQPRVEEMLAIILDDLIQKELLPNITGGIVITGGTALLPGISEVCQDVFNLQTRIGYPKVFNGFGDKLGSPEYSVVSGLLNWGYGKMADGEQDKVTIEKGEQKDGFFSKLKKFFTDDLF